MGKIKTDVSERILEKLPLEQKELEKVLTLGLKQYSTRHKSKRKTSIVSKTFGALPIKNHDLIEKIRKQVKYGE